jgi:hypothetical protein
MSCDSLPEDRLPGEALGCESYKDSNEITRYAVGFERLCREKAIGCQPLWDTHNTLEGDGSDRAQAFNVLCFGDGNATCKIVHNEQELGNCFVPRGESSCYVPKIVIPTGLTWDTFKTAMTASNNNVRKVDLDASSIVTLADTPESSPIFLASGEKQKYTCDKGAVSCQKSGLEEKYLPSNATTSFQFSEFFVKNDPDKYTETICRNDLVGCTKYSDAGKETYFKDPVVTGGSLCKWKNPGENENRTYGWFLEGISHCQNNADTLCKSDSDCGEGDTCLQIDVACAPDHMVGDGMYDIWSNETPLKYQGNVGICPATANQCREIIDRQDTSHVNPDGKPYYVIFNEKVAKKRDGTECPGNQVSLTEGCVLFDKTDEPNKLYDSAATYKRSEKKPDNPYGLVPPVTPNDAASFGFRRSDSNLVLKVDRSRECSEWLGCESQALVQKPTGEYTYVCEKVGACEKLGSNNGECGGNVDPLSSPEDNNLAMNRLTNDQYVSRKVSWFDEEFSGYSLYNRFQIGNLMYIYFKFPKAFDELVGRSAVADHSYVARVVSESLFRGNDGLDKDCYADDDSPTNWSICGFDDGGRCYNNNCIYPVDGVFKPEEKVDPAYIAVQDDLSTQGAQIPSNMWDQISKIIARLEPDSCKSAPENDSPFSSEISEIGIKEAYLEEGGSVYRNYSVDRKPGFENTNFCQDGECTCSYKKISYKNGVTDYWPTEVKVRQPAANICAGGPREGSPCTANPNICNDGNSKYECVPTTREDVFIGYSGFCLEYDLGRPNKYNGQYPCLTWLPVQGSVSPFDLYNAEKDAGYNPDVDAKVMDGDDIRGGVAYCTEATILKNPKEQGILDTYKEVYEANGEDLGAGYNTITNNKIPPGDIEHCNMLKLGTHSDGERRTDYYSIASKFQGTFCHPKAKGSVINQANNPTSETGEFLTSWIIEQTGDDSAQLLRMESSLSIPDYKNVHNDGGYAAFFGSIYEKTVYEGMMTMFGPVTTTHNITINNIESCGSADNPIPCMPYGFAPARSGEVKDGIYTSLGPVVHPPRLFGMTLENAHVETCFVDLLNQNRLNLCQSDDQAYNVSLNFDFNFPEGDNQRNYAPAGMCGTTRRTQNIPQEAIEAWSVPADADVDRSTITIDFINDFVQEELTTCINGGRSDVQCLNDFNHGLPYGDSIVSVCQGGVDSNPYALLNSDNIAYAPNGLCSQRFQEDHPIAEAKIDEWVRILQSKNSVIPTAADIWNTAYELIASCIDMSQSENFSGLFSYQSAIESKISPVFMSPEVGDWMSMSSGDGENKFAQAYTKMFSQGILPSRFEYDLNLSQVNRVYFMPTGFPEGPEGSLPQLLDTTAMFIDFSEIDKAFDEQTGLIFKSVPVTPPDYTGENEHFFAKVSAGIGNVYTGLDISEEVNGDISLEFGTVSGTIKNILDKPQNASLKTRNNVYKRYYLIYSPTSDIVREEDGKTIPAQDFFDDQALCSDGQTYFAVGMDFNVDGEFLGYVSNWCMAFNEDGFKYGIQFAVVATYNNMCTEINKVYDTKRPEFTSFLRKDSNKAWTNRVWKQALSKAPRLSASDLPTNQYYGLSKHVEEMPFGSLNLGDSLLTVSDNSYLEKFVYAFRNSEWKGVSPQGGAGVPFSCTDGDCSNLSYSGYDAGLVESLEDKTKIQAQSLLHQLFAKEYMKVELGVGGRVQCLNSFSRRYNFSNLAQITCPGNNDADRLAIIVNEFNGNDGAYYGIDCDGRITEEEARLGSQFIACLESPNSIDETSVDFSNVRTTFNQLGRTVKLLPPQIYSIQPYTCLVEKGKVCPPWEKDSFTIGNYNGSLGDYDSDGRNDEDKDGNGSPDPLVVFGNMYYARMRFFAFADDNRMPIRRIKIDWADSTPLDQLDKRGLYKNRKPVCEDGGNGAHVTLSVCVDAATRIPTAMPCLNAEDVEDNQVSLECPVNQVCLSKSDLANGSLGGEYQVKQFGNLPRACENHYFEYSHQYTCSSEEVNKVRLTGGDGGDGPIMRIDNPLLGSGVTNVLRTYPGVDYVCAFKPKVQIEDNWGWCNGSCTKVYVNGNPVGGDTPAEQIGCYNAWPAPNGRDPNNTYNQCETPVPDKINPWTEYKQYVIMVPSRE